MDEVSSGAAHPGPEFCDVSLPVPMDQAFTYRLPVTLRHRVKPGCRVLVPFASRKLTGVVLAWATEALDRGLISLEETAGIRLAFGEVEPYIQAVRNIVRQPNDFYRSLAKGARAAASQYGGEDFALTFGGNEMPGYHTGPACHLGYLTGARHSHLDSAGYSLDQQAAKAGRRLTPTEVAEKLLAEERWRQVLTSLVICLFARKVYDAETILDALATAGYRWTETDLDRLGIQTLRVKYAFKQREGFSFDSLVVPRRVIETPSPAGPFDEVFVRAAVQHYAQQL